MEKITRGSVLMCFQETNLVGSGLVIDSTDFNTYIISSDQKITTLDQYGQYDYTIFSINVSQIEKDEVLSQILKEFIFKKYTFIKKLLQPKILSSELTAIYLKQLMINYTLVVNNWSEKLISLTQIYYYMKQNQNYFSIVFNKN